MQLSLALVLAVTLAAVEALPGATFTKPSRIDTRTDKSIEARGLLSGLVGGLGSGRGSSTTSSSSTSTSSVTSPTSSSTSTPNGGATDDVPTDTKVETYGNDVITTIHTAGTTGDRVGFRWIPVGSSE